MNLNNLNLKHFLKKYRQYISHEKDLQEYINSHQNLLNQDEIKNLKKVNLLSYLSWGFISLNVLTITVSPTSNFHSFIFWFLFFSYNALLFYFFPKFKLFLNKNEYQSHVMKYALRSDVKFYFQQHEAIFYSSLNELLQKNFFFLLPSKKTELETIMKNWKEHGLTTTLIQDLLVFLTSNNLQHYLYSHINRKSKSFDSVQKWFVEYDYMVKTRDENFNKYQQNELNYPTDLKIEEEQMREIEQYNSEQKNSNFIRNYFNNKNDSKFSLLKFKSNEQKEN